MDNTPFKEIKKNDRFEILALLREAKKKKGSVEFSYQDKIFSSRFHNLDLAGFQIVAAIDTMPSNSPINMVIKGTAEKIAFSAVQLEHDAETQMMTFSFPEEVVITQRRSNVRVNIPESYAFFCEGRFRDGFVHRMALKDLSTGGLQLECTTPLPPLTRPGMLLKNITLNLQNYGQFTVDLVLLNIKEITQFEDDNQAAHHFSLSCAFSKPAGTFTRRMENILMELILDLKRLQRIR